MDVHRRSVISSSAVIAIGWSMLMARDIFWYGIDDIWVRIDAGIILFSIWTFVFFILPDSTD